MQSSRSQILIYRDEKNNVKLDVRFENENVWLTQKSLADLFQTSIPNINIHIKNILDEGELKEIPTIKNYLIVQTEGKREIERDQKFYNLEMIISLGYRVNSKTATQFRIWATDKLKNFIVKGFVIDDERLKNPDLPFDYFEELSRKITEIRTSEKRFYRKITDIYATSIDYDPTDEQSILFFKTVQNKIHFAITGNTAAEIIVNRIDSKKANFGLTNFRGGKPNKEEILVAKNYLNQEELLALNNLVEQYLIFAQGQAMQRVPMRMKDWIEKLHGFLTLNNRKILDHAGKISHELAKEIAEKEYEIYFKKSLESPSPGDKDFENFLNLQLSKRVDKIMKNENIKKKVIKKNK